MKRCTGTLTHPLLIKLLCKLVGLFMSESEEKTPPKISFPIPKSREGSTSQDTCEANYEEEGDIEQDAKDDEITVE